MSTPYYCHQCARTVQPEADRSLRCSVCHGEFIEEVNINDEYFQPAQNNEENNAGEVQMMDAPDFFRMMFDAQGQQPGSNPRAPNQNASAGSSRQSQFIPILNNGASSSRTSGQPRTNPQPGNAQPNNAQNAQNQPEFFADFLNQLVANLSANAPQGATFQFQFNGAPIHGDVNNYVFGDGSFDQLISTLLNSAETQQQGLSQDDLDLLTKSSIDQEQVDNGVQCTTCMETFEKGENVIKLDCNHVFHEGCIFPWLIKNKTCPICRTEVEAKAPKKTKSTVITDIDELD